MTTSQNPNIDQENESGSNINVPGNNNTIQIHNTTSQPQTPLSRSIRDRYRDLPTNEDRQRFRALGVLFTGLNIDKSILSALWNTHPASIDGLVYILELEQLMKTVGGGIYSTDDDCIRYASAKLTSSEREIFARRYQDFIVRNVTIDSNQGIYILHLRYMNTTMPSRFVPEGSSSKMKSNFLLKILARIISYISRTFSRRF